MDEAALRRLAEDWATIWQSEMAARGSDPETGETVRAMIELWLRADGLAWAGHDAGADAPAGTAAADAAPGAGDGAELAALRRRLDALERRLADGASDRS
jgi:hypothetical protein